MALRPRVVDDDVPVGALVVLHVLVAANVDRDQGRPLVVVVPHAVARRRRLVVLAAGTVHVHGVGAVRRVAAGVAAAAAVRVVRLGGVEGGAGVVVGAEDEGGESLVSQRSHRVDDLGGGREIQTRRGRGQVEVVGGRLALEAAPRRGGREGEVAVAPIAAAAVVLLGAVELLQGLLSGKGVPGGVHPLVGGVAA